MTREEFVQQALARPQYWANHTPEDGAYETMGAVIGVHRDSDTLARSNWEVISADLQERFPEAFMIKRSRHFLVGWSETLFVDARDETAVDACVEWLSKLEDYPVACDEHWSRLESEEAQETWKGFKLADRVHACQKARLSVFAARHDKFPEDPQGTLLSYLAS